MLAPIVAGLALLGATAAVVIAINSAGTRAEDVAQRVTPEVTRQVVATSRAETALDGRSRLARWNAVLAGRGLPIIGEPPPDATAEDVRGAWITARVLAILPTSVTDDLAAQVAAGRAPRVLPSFGLPSSDPGDIVVTVLPENDEPARTVAPARPRGGSGGGTGTGPASPRPGTATRAPTAPRPTPAPAAPPRGGGLLRPCLLGAVLC